MMRRGILALAVALLFLTAPAAGNAQDLGPLLGLPSLDGSEEEAKAKDAQEAKERDEAKDEPTFQFFPEDLQLPEAKKKGSPWRRFFDRAAIGFDLGTLRTLPQRLGKIVAPVRTWWGEMVDDPFGPPLQQLSPVLGFVCLLVLLFLFDRRIGPWTTPVIARWTVRFPPWTKRPVAAMATILRYTLPAFALQVFATVGTAFFHAEGTAGGRILGRALWYFLAYRALQGIATALLGGNVLEVSPDRIRKLGPLVRWGLRVLLIFNLVLIALDITKFDPELRALVRFSLQVIVMGLTIRLAWLRPEVMSLLPELDENVVWARMRGVIERNFRWFLGISVGLLGLWAIGFENAAKFLLTRGYAIIGLVAVGAVAQRRFSGFIDRRMSDVEQDAQREGLQRLERGGQVTLVLTLAFLVFSVLGLWEFLLAFLKFPLLRAAGRDISIYGLGQAALLFGVFVLISRALRPFLMERVYPRIGLEIGVGYAINTVAHYVLVTVGFLTALSALGVNLGAIAVLATAFSVGIGFGLQDITRNLVSGFILLFGRSVKKGDLIRMGEQFGRVESLGARSVHIVTPDNTELVIPSSMLVAETITNYTYTSPQVRVHIPVGVHYDSDVRHVEQALLNAAKRHRAVLRKPAPEVWLKGFGDSSVDFELLVWIDVRRIDRLQLTGELNFHIWDVLKEQGIAIPYPQRDLRIQPDRGLDTVVRAIRGEDRAPEPVAQAPPRLERVDSYLRWHDALPQAPATDVAADVVAALRSAGRRTDRSQSMRRMLFRVLEENRHELRRYADEVIDHLRENPTDKEHKSIDRMPS